MLDWFDRMGDFNLDVARSNSADVYRAARLALLKMQAERTFEQTDAALHNVEGALEDAAATLRNRFGTKSRVAH